MLQLARQLMPSRTQLAASRLPVILPLSTWSRRERSFQSWIAASIGKEYYSSLKFVEGWIEAGRLVFLLEGLDEVRVEDRASCIHAINGFVIETGAAAAITCRLDDYEAVSTPLVVREALVLQALEPARIDAFLEDKGPGLSFLRAAIQGDALWLEIAQSPLMLSVMVRTYDRLTAKELESARHATKDARQRFLWERYLETRIERKPRKYPETSEQIRTGLRWLALRMQTHRQTAFFLDRLQPSWLDRGIHRWEYAVLTRAAAATTIAIAFWVLVVLSGAFSLQYRSQIATSSATEIVMYGLGIVLAGLLWGVVKGIQLAKNERRTKPQGRARAVYAGLCGLGMVALSLTTDAPKAGASMWMDVSAAFIWGALLYPVCRGLRQLNYSPVLRAWQSNTLRILGGLAFGIVGGALSALVDTPADRSDDLEAGVLVGIILGAITYRSPTSQDDIKVFEATRWSWRNALTWASASVLFVTALLLLLIFGQSPTAFSFGFWRVGVLYGVRFGLPLALVGFILGGWKRDHRTRKIRPNEGILIAGKTATAGAAMGAALGALLMVGWQIALRQSGLGFWGPALDEGLKLVPGGAFCAALLVALGKGGAQLQRHYVLRSLLSREPGTPRQLQRFLDLGASMNLLRRSGGSYAFLHDLLRDHCAAQSETSEPMEHNATAHSMS